MKTRTKRDAAGKLELVTGELPVGRSVGATPKDRYNRTLTALDGSGKVSARLCISCAVRVNRSGKMKVLPLRVPEGKQDAVPARGTCQVCKG